MPLFDITVSGCDDRTKITIPLTSVTLRFLTGIAEQITAASEFSCMPKMTVHPHIHDEDCPEDHQ